MAATPADLFERLAELGIASRTVEHAPVFTVAESEKLQAPGEPGVGARAAPTKNLFLKDAKDRLFLVVAHAQTVVDLKALPKLIGSARLSFGKPDLMLEVLGVTPGSVTAFAVINDPAGRVDVVIDANLMTYDTVDCHPLINSATTNIAREDLLRFIRSCGHAPRILYVSSDATAGGDGGPVGAPAGH